MPELIAQTEQLAELLFRTGRRVVLAESCTAGLASATLARMPGISEYLCGSAVVYRNATKVGWLGVSEGDLAVHTAVSEPVAAQMAIGALERTGEADYAASVTGHLGPGAPREVDGVVFIAVAVRRDERIALAGTFRHVLAARSRIERQAEAAALLLVHLYDVIASNPD